jgi:hypothetical protein
MVIRDKSTTLDSIKKVPDGTLLLQKVSDEKFGYRVQILDHLQFQYHRNNGITKIGIVQEKERDESSEIALDDYGNTTYILRPTEGAMQLIDRMNNAYVRSHFNDTYIISG